MSCQCGCGRLIHLADERWFDQTWFQPRPLPKIRLHYWPHVNAQRPWCAVINIGKKRSVMGNLWPTPAGALANAWNML